ncbi:MAG TPA: RNA chaperone Hfq [Acidobacteriaceae bacterium]|nr:RNA chaperone Hfq [Acidobacteriaceae bacterium]
MPNSNQPFPTSAPLATNGSSDAGRPVGQRKLVRPSLSARALAEHRDNFSHNSSVVLTTRDTQPAVHPENSRTETLYFEKQMQTQTRMVVVLEDGEHIEGVLEWHDRNTIKMRNGNRQRTMIYKSSIKYLYKATEATQQHPIMQ